MQISSLLSDDEIKELQQKFYEYFETGYAFEEFLKEYLLKMGLDEVQVTQRSRDGGVDLTAIRKGVGDFSELDITHYYIQAKRYAYENSVGSPAVNQLSGSVPDGHKGILITTSKFSVPAEQAAAQHNLRPIILIDGKALITSCIDNEIGFIFKPIFSPKQMDIFVGKRLNEHATETAQEIPNINENDYIEKVITSNDVRARIISVPSYIMKQFEEDQKSVDIIVNNDKKYHFNINKVRNYFGSVTSFLRDYNLLSDDGVITPKQIKWFYDLDNRIVYLSVED